MLVYPLLVSHSERSRLPSAPVSSRLSAPVKVRSEIGLEWAAKLWSRRLLDGAPGGTVKSRTEPAASPHRSLVPG